MAKKKPTESGEKLLSIAEGAAYLGVTRQTIHAAINRKNKPLKAKKGKFTVERVVKTVQTGWVIDKRDLEDYRVSEQHQDAGKKNE